MVLAVSLFHSGENATHDSNKMKAGSRKWNPKPADRSQRLAIPARSKHGMKQKITIMKLLPAPCFGEG